MFFTDVRFFWTKCWWGTRKGYAYDKVYSLRTKQSVYNTIKLYSRVDEAEQVEDAVLQEDVEAADAQ